MLGIPVVCDTLVVVRPDGVLFAKSSDRDPNEAQILDWQPRRRHPSGARVACTWLEIPQVPGTHALLLSRPFWMWGAEIGTNEHGVTIGNEAVFTRQPRQKTPALTGMDLLRLALERADTASAAVQVITTLLETHGQGGGAGLENPRFTYDNSFIVADPRCAFVVETAGRLSAVEEVVGSRAISNGLTIAGFDQTHSRFLETRVSECRARRSRTEAAARAAAGPGDLMRALRDHGEGRMAPCYSWVNGAMDSVCMHGGGLLASSQTTASWVSDLKPSGNRHWVTATAAPCTGLFKPVRLEEPIPAAGPGPTEVADARSLWWRHERLHRRVAQDPVRLLPRFAPERDETEARWLREPPDSLDAFETGDALLASWQRAVGAEARRDVRPIWVRRYWRRRNAMAGLG